MSPPGAHPPAPGQAGGSPAGVGPVGGCPARMGKCCSTCFPPSLCEDETVLLPVWGFFYPLGKGKEVAVIEPVLLLLAGVGGGCASRVAERGAMLGLFAVR